ncbi:unnamed protein product [Rhizophagus irregularis]|uniref:Uncharacterized protein n=1 Tax=Rhizophagus irregularis TaxID=588596 RepID=A0A2I1H7P8_9GLOM|nr:hypothetical protein RhiirA4_473946 [Rhizophagus irregularis]CAB4419709.1 unnamed protein product [Rhizophagus irregularis]
MALTSAIAESKETNKFGRELQLKNQDDFIDEHGDLKDKFRRTRDDTFASKSNGRSMEWITYVDFSFRTSIARQSSV